MSIKKDILWRIYPAYGLICLAGLAVTIQVGRIQISEGEFWNNMADSLTTAYRTIPAERGNIFADDGSLLATSLPFFEVRVDLKSEAMTDELFDANVDSLAWHLAAFNKDRSYIQWRYRLVQGRKNGVRYMLIHRKVTYPELLDMKTWPLFRHGKYKGGFIALQRNKRVTPYRMLAHRTIGYVREGVLPVGLEGAFDDHLAGVHGKRLVQKISGGVEIPINDDNEIEPRNGRDLITTIDVNQLQDVAEDALEKALYKHNADHGSVVVMEVETGAIKAIANLGLVNGQYWETYNYAIGEATEPGSTYKLASIIALLEHGKVDVDDKVDLEKGQTMFYNFKMEDSEPHDRREVSVAEAFEFSSNVGIAKLVFNSYKKEPNVFVEQLRKMRLGEKTGVEIKGEGTPFIHTPESKEWSGVSLAQMSIGYEVKITPLQLLTLYNAIANNGVMVKPYLVKEIQEYGNTIQKFEPQVLNKKICSKATLEKVQALLVGVVEKGTARRIRSKDYKIAGKTGTAQIWENDYKSGYQASFAGYFPADDPIYSCIVVINKPRNGSYYGGSVAAPVFKEIADRIYANNLKMHPSVNNERRFYTENIPSATSGYKADAKTLYNHLGISYRSVDNADWIRCKRIDETIEFSKVELIIGLVPNVVGMGLKDALYLLENAGLKVKVNGAGKVRTQSVKPGLKADNANDITIELS